MACAVCGWKMPPEPLPNLPVEDLRRGRFVWLRPDVLYRLDPSPWLLDFSSPDGGMFRAWSRCCHGGIDVSPRAEGNFWTPRPLRSGASGGFPVEVEYIQLILGRVQMAAAPDAQEPPEKRGRLHHGDAPT